MTEKMKSILPLIIGEKTRGYDGVYVYYPDGDVAAIVSGNIAAMPNPVSAQEMAEIIVNAVNSRDALVEAIEKLLKNPNLYPCEHTSTHRGGSIWEICDDCGASFADDQGGVPKHKEHPSITNAISALKPAGAE